MLIGQLQLAVIEPNGDRAARQSALGRQREAPHADVATEIDDPFELKVTDCPGEVVGIQFTATGVRSLSGIRSGYDIDTIWQWSSRDRCDPVVLSGADGDADGQSSGQATHSPICRPGPAAASRSRWPSPDRSIG